MGKRILLFVVTNIAIIVTISIVFTLLGLAGYQLPTGYAGLAIFCLIWGFGGAFISLQMSRWIAKRAMGVQLVCFVIAVLLSAPVTCQYALH